MTDAPKTDGLRVVVGLGLTGISCVRFLRERGFAVAVNDTRASPPGLAELERDYPEVAGSLGRLDGELLLRAAEIVVSPGISINEPELRAARDAGIPVVGDIELFCRETDKPIVAITGSNAKSTVTTLVGLMAENAGIAVGVGGNLGTPVLALLQQPADLYVLELSSFQLETTHSLRAAAAVILNISEDHMDRYKNMQEYCRAKQRIFRNCHFYITNRQDPLTVPELTGETPHNSFGTDMPDAASWGILREGERSWLALGERKLLAADEMAIFGEHNMANALAAMALASAVNIPEGAILRTLREFPGLPHRCQKIGVRQGVSWYNDSKGTNVGATLAAINGLGAAINGKVILIAGGVGKGQDFSPLSEAMARFGGGLVLIGEDAPRIDAAVSASVRRISAGTLAEAVHAAAGLAAPGDAVLLSPACASFDMFRNYEDRGRQFVDAARAIGVAS